MKRSFSTGRRLTDKNLIVRVKGREEEHDSCASCECTASCRGVWCAYAGGRRVGVGPRDHLVEVEKAQWSDQELRKQGRDEKRRQAGLGKSKTDKELRGR